MKPSLAGATVVVAGGTGFIGSYLVERILDAGARVRVPMHKGRGHLEARRDDVAWMGGDVRDTSFCNQLLERATLLIHCLSFRKNVAFHREHGDDVLRENVLLSAELARAARARCIPTLFFSSANAITAEERQPGKVQPDGYALGKRACELLWEQAAQEGGFPLLITRPTNVYGPRDRFAEDGNVIPSLFIRAQTAQDALDVWGDGAQECRFLFVEDLAEATMTLLRAEATGTQPIAPPDVTTIRKLASAIVALVRPGLPLRFDPSKPEGAPLPPLPALHPSLAAIRWTPLEEGLRKTFAWWRRTGA